MRTEAQKKAVAKYQENLERVSIWVTPEEKDRWNRMAVESGRSLTQFIKDCVEAVGADLLPMPVSPEGILIKEELPQLEE